MLSDDMDGTPDVPVSSGNGRRRAKLAAAWCAPLLLAALGVFLVPAGASGSVASAPGANQPINAPLLYAQSCASCHGVTAAGTSRGPSLQGVGIAAVDFYLSTGRMPRRGAERKDVPYRAYFSPAAVAALDDYVTALAAHGGPQIPSVNLPAGDLAQGGELFRENCAACHEAVGVGGELTDRPIPALTEATPKQVAEAVRVGPSQMPKFGTAAINQQQLDSIAAYVNYLHHPLDKGGEGLSHLGPIAEGAVAWLVGIAALMGIARWIGKRG